MTYLFYLDGLKEPCATYVSIIFLPLDFSEILNILNISNTTDVFDDEALALHEHQVQVMNNYYNENKKIFKLIEKREASWQNKMDFEVRKLEIKVVHVLFYFKFVCSDMKLT